ncbi:unnamed protein product [Prorocentrum cordatum]|uniref:RNA helicase n=1 Tax=Prorocentrum cordatum TaxID=2364126 RepID=A0ABN9Y6H4_9DINO|nr:unnamed protein product [Polarella glacialis]
MIKTTQRQQQPAPRRNRWARGAAGQRVRHEDAQEQSAPAQHQQRQPHLPKIAAQGWEPGQVVSAPAFLAMLDGEKNSEVAKVNLVMALPEQVQKIRDAGIAQSLDKQLTVCCSGEPPQATFKEAAAKKWMRVERPGKGDTVELLSVVSVISKGVPREIGTTVTQAKGKVNDLSGDVTVTVVRVAFVKKYMGTEAWRASPVSALTSIWDTAPLVRIYGFRMLTDEKDENNHIAPPRPGGFVLS